LERFSLMYTNKPGCPEGLKKCIKHNNQENKFHTCYQGNIIQGISRAS
jgi:hypothetical protein